MRADERQAAQASEKQADLDAAAEVRRAILPWRRKIRNVSRLDFTPRGHAAYGHDPISGFLFLLMFPLWLPALIAGLFAIVEFLLAAPFVPIALLYRKVRGAWPVELIDGRGHVMERTYHPSWSAAGAHALHLREQGGGLLRWL